MSMKVLARKRAGSGRCPREDALPRWDYRASGERLTALQERELSDRARRGDQAARERIMAANIPLVASIARRFHSSCLEREDLLQEGMIGLCMAVERYEPEKGYRFSTYATHWIRSRIQRAVDDSRLIRLPVDVIYAGRKAQALRRSMAEELGREPTLAELAGETGISPGRLRALLDCPEEPLSLDDPGSDDARRALELSDPEDETPEETVLRTEQGRQLDCLLGTLDARDRMVLESRFDLVAETESMPGLAQRAGISQQGVRQLQRRALLKLRRRIERSAHEPGAVRWDWEG